MNLNNVPIKRKLTTVIMLTSSVVLLLTAAVFISYEVITLRGNLVRNAQTIAQIIAANSTVALSFDDEKTGTEILSKLRAERSIVLASLYTRDGRMLAHFPNGDPPSAFPPSPGKIGTVFEGASLKVFFPVQEDNKQLGTLFLESDLAPVYQRFRLYAGLAFLVLIGSSVVAYFLSHWLQKSISQPILELAETAKAVSINKDYLVRAQKYGNDELGVFTDAFNDMLTQIHQRDAALRENEGRLKEALLASKTAEGEIRNLNAELEARVQSRTAELGAINKELEAFTYSVSHDLRAPLRHIDAFAQILDEEAQTSVPPELRQYITKIRQGAQNMGHLVDDLLNLSRVGRGEMVRKPIKLNAVVDEVIAEIRMELGKREVEWRIAPLPTVPGDPGLIKQIFVNLISNAVKYSRPRANAVIELGQEMADGQLAVFVRDNGVGFNMKYADKLFGVFHRLHRAEEFEGTGVGLATVQRIIQLHQGRIWVEAEVGKGATFHFTLPGMYNE